MKEKIIEMLKIQEALDNSFMKYMGRTEPLTVEEVSVALFDECGELCHALKADWCYWKKSEKPVNREEVKEELADVWHFVLFYHRLLKGFEFDDKTNDYLFRVHKRDNWFDLLKLISDGSRLSLFYTIILTEKLGFTFDEIYQAYIGKNKENYERMKRGY